MARNRNKSRSKIKNRGRRGNKHQSIKYKSTEFKPVLIGEKDISKAPILRAVVDQLRKNNSNKIANTGITSNPKDLQFLTDLFNASPSIDTISQLPKRFPQLANNKNLINEALKRITTVDDLVNVASGLGIDIKDSRIQNQFKKITSGADINTNIADSTITNSADVYKNIYVPPSNAKVAERPSQSSSKAFTPISKGKLSSGYIASQRAIGNAPTTVTKEINPVAPTATYNYAEYTPVLPKPKLKPDIPIPASIPTGLSNTPTINPYQPNASFTPLLANTGNDPSELFSVGGNAPTTLDASQLALQPPNTGLQYNGLGITNNTPTGVIPQLGVKSNDNGFHFTRKSMFGDDKTIGWLTGGAQVASSIMDIYNGYKAAKLAREQYELKKNAYKLDYQNQAKLLNRDILRQERNFAAIQNRKHTGTRDQYYNTINKQADKAFQKHKLDPNAANNF